MIPMKKSILIIDDDPLVLKTLQNLLKQEDYEILTGKSTAQAEETLSTKTPDLILCDIRMPAEDGLTFVKRLRKNPPRPEIINVPVIFITGYASEEAPIKAMQMGAASYVLKPFDNEELRASIRKAISQGRVKETDRALSDLKVAFETLKALVERYQRLNQKVIKTDAELSRFFDKLEESLLEMERRLIESER